MRFLAVDDEKMSLEALVLAIEEALPNNEIVSFRNANDALKYFKENKCDIAFLDIKMRGITGIELAEKLREIEPKTNIVFVTGYSDYSLDAFKVSASDYLLKPVDAEQVRNAVANLRYPIELGDVVRVQCFGNFEVFYNDKPIKFKRSKSKELFAYLVDRHGSSCTMQELIEVLWGDSIEDSSKQSNLRNLIADLRAAFNVIEKEDIIIKDKNNISVNCTLFECDYYDYLNKKEYAINKYRGEYMSQYSWTKINIGPINNRRVD